MFQILQIVILWLQGWLHDLVSGRGIRQENCFFSEGAFVVENMGSFGPELSIFRIFKPIKNDFELCSAYHLSTVSTKNDTFLLSQK